MIDESGIINQPNPTSKHRSLLNKYEIPIDHLSYEYIGVCKDVKELERIVRILRSGEEGYYPDLQQKAEERLRSLSPNNRQLRTEQPVLTRNSMNSEEWKNVMSDVSNWRNEISMRDRRLSEENNNTMEEITLPPIRQPSLAKAVNVDKSKAAEEAPRPKRASDYTAWDKYDADTELLKMDLAQEREKEERLLERKQQETDRLETVVSEAEKLSETERLVLADQEKNRGNEYYQAKEYNEAVKYYTASIAIWPTPNAYNNRAACYLKQCKYSAALEDTNCTLQLEPNNVKALFRRGVALQHKNMFREALIDMNAVIKQEPKNLVAQHISKELREQILNLPKTVRIMKDEGYDKPKKVEEVTTKSLTRESFAGNSYEVNEWGLPKVMCQCNGSPRFLRFPRQTVPTVHFTPRLAPVVNNAKIVEISDEPEPPTSTTKLEIIEVQKLDAAEDVYNSKKCVVVEAGKTQIAEANGEARWKNVQPNGDFHSEAFGQSSTVENKQVSDDSGCGKHPSIEYHCKPMCNGEQLLDFKQKKCVVLDKRTQKNLTNGDITLTNGESKMSNGDSGMADSENWIDLDCMDLNLNSSILDEATKPIKGPSV